MAGEMKKRLQRRGARKGFTLVELLIVIIIIGILAGAMMLVAGTSRDSAEASKIISDLRTMKAATLMWLTENPTGITPGVWDNLNRDPSPLNAYLDKPISVGQHNFKFANDGKLTTKVIKGSGTTGDEYEYGSSDTEDVLLLGYDLSGVRSGVKRNLAKQAESAGLFNSKTIDLTATTLPYYTEEDTTAYVIVQ